MKWRLTLDIYDEDNKPVTRESCDFNFTPEQLMETANSVGLSIRDMMLHGLANMLDTILNPIFDKVKHHTSFDNPPRG